MSPAPVVPTETYGAVIPLKIEKNDTADSLRKFIYAAVKRIGTMIMQTWLSRPGAYTIDITVTMEKEL